MEAHHWAALAKGQPTNLAADPQIMIMGQVKITRDRQVILFYNAMEESYTLYVQRSAQDYDATPYDMSDHWSDEEIMDDFLRIASQELEVQRILNRGSTE